MSTETNVKGPALRRKETAAEEHKYKEWMAINIYLSIINLNVNGLSAPIKRQRIPEWIRKQDP